MEFNIREYEQKKKSLQRIERKRNQLGEQIEALEEEKQELKAEFRATYLEEQKIVEGLTEQQRADLWHFLMCES